MNQSLKHQRGMTLLELAIALVVVGIIVAAAATLYTNAQQQRKIQTTRERMDTIVQALSTYAETAGRVPCPADPSAGSATVDPLLFGWEYGVAVADLQVVRAAASFPTGSCGALGSFTGGPVNPTVGILPFMTLGLSAEVAKDGWGDYFTYAVSPVFAKQNDQAAGPKDTGTVHGRCRHAGWDNPNDPTNYNRNAVKARFCCADQAAPAYNNASDLIVNYAGTVTPLSPPARAPATGAGSTRTDTSGNIYNVYDQIEKPTTMQNSGIAVPTIDTSPVEAPAFVLVSHGPDGLGAYLGNNTLNKNGAPGGLEGENSNGDQTFVDGPPKLTAPNYFDDIVRWMTQDGLLAAHGALSCQYP